MDQPSTPSVRDLFDSSKVQFEIPVYQRAYVWSRERNWEPLWQDIVDTVDRYASEPDAGAPLKHFLGPIVLHQQPTAVGTVERRLVIDGQQRLTTLQVLLAATRSIAEEANCTDVVAELNGLLTNRGRGVDGLLAHKLRPSRRDRDDFVAIMNKLPVASAEEESPDTGILGAYTFFVECVRNWSVSDGESEAQDVDAQAERLRTLHDCLAELVYVVAIHLDDTDNPQVIFETLNARGTALGALDLVKNSVFHAAERVGAAQRMHDEYWEPTFERTDYWSEEVRQGRERRPRADWFLMHWLAIEQGRVVRSDRLFETFNRGILKAPGTSIVELVPRLCRDAQLLRSFDSYDRDSVEGRFFSRLASMDTTTMLPVALLVFRAERDGAIDVVQRRRALAAMESWLVRRAVLRLTSQNYNRVLAAVLASATNDLQYADRAITDALRAGRGNAARWPGDDEVRRRLESGDLYGYVGTPRVRMLLEATELDLRAGPWTEPEVPPSNLSIEHILPQTWEDNWPLPSDVDPQEAHDHRTERLHRLGNLTLVTQPLNSALSNAPWRADDEHPIGKREALAPSVLLLNRDICTPDQDWDEERIDQRGRDLTERILKTWPSPDDSQWNS